MSIIQIQSITLNNFKNVVHGSVEFKNHVLGVYGQNGSGKTAIINALEFLQCLARGDSLNPKAAHYIFRGQKSSECTFLFNVFENDEIVKTLSYTFSVELNQESGLQVVAEQLVEKVPDKKQTTLIKYEKNNETQWLTPAADWKTITSNKDFAIKLGVLREIAGKERRSFIFSNDFSKIVKESQLVDVERINTIEQLKHFTNENLFVIRNNGNGPFNLDFSLPFNGTIQISLISPTVTDKPIFDIINNTFTELNIVLQEIVPGLKVVVQNEGPQQTPDGKEGVRFELLSQRDDNPAIPLLFESEGIKKIISILSLLISVYNNPSTFLAVDELDAGVFEFLLGEILEIIEEKANGKLLFTSHNLRPLEMIKKESLIFTTTNPENRYTRLSGLQTNNNPRSVYLRSISLGGQKDPIYQETNHFKIARAFRKAGKIVNGKN
jgi:RecF/RecN/SMC N terminal domain.